MCRNIKPLFNFDPPATDEEIHDASLQYVRKLSGFQKPSNLNKEAFDLAVAEISVVTKQLMQTLVTSSPHKDRAIQAQIARERSAKRFGTRN